MRLLKVAAAVLALTVLTATGLEARKKLLGEGEGQFKTIDLKGLPEFSFDAELTAEERAYLGLPEGGAFTINSIGADLVVVEFLNVYCYACVMQAPIMNQVHERLKAREDLHDRIRFLGIAVGNGPKEIATFKERMDVTYPVLSDEEFKAIDAFGNPGGTPFIILYPRTGTEGAAARAHLGVWSDVDGFVTALEESLDPGAPPAGEPEYQLTTWRNLAPDLSPEGLEETLRGAAAEIGFAAESIAPVEVEGEENVFRLTAASGRGLWAKVAGRAKICNICHDIFFILLFDDDGRIVNFTPIHVTKYENVPIDEKDTAFMKERVIGRMLTEPVHFDSDVDAISRATMSSELIFDTIRRLGPALEDLRK